MAKPSWALGYDQTKREETTKNGSFAPRLRDLYLSDDGPVRFRKAGLHWDVQTMKTRPGSLA